ncbi:MAG: L,D-transpeptidase family protein [Sulfurimonas sp.]|uniref:L,D-transpeptidase family protein n=1 Tax=Sulfurimonas sp. TaxID=2022749 RepID=UPI0026244B45|nr:L,D-transpeptidase family protein [Sulfurimonas sp.]MDD5372501.1 L,D-transpeptidase family protein [Sulfurimonas sp.]
MADDFNSQRATLSCFEENKPVFDSFKVNIGKGGLGHGLGEVEFAHSPLEPLKQEGDNKAPIGVFTLDAVFGYEEDIKIKMPYLYATKDLICVDDSESSFYNQILKTPKVMPKSFEEMRRDDAQYELGIVVGHNKEQIRKAGSCIFLHVESSEDAPTAGCTSMKLEDIQKIVSWLDKSKNPILIQITKSQKDEVLKLYPMLKLEE